MGSCCWRRCACSVRLHRSFHSHQRASHLRRQYVAQHPCFGICTLAQRQVYVTSSAALPALPFPESLDYRCYSTQSEDDPLSVFSPGFRSLLESCVRNDSRYYGDRPPIGFQHKSFLDIIDFFASQRPVSGAESLLTDLPYILHSQNIKPELFEAWIFAISSPTFEDALEYINQNIVVDNPFPLWVSEYLPFNFAYDSTAPVLTRFLDFQMVSTSMVEEFSWYRVQKRLPNPESVHHAHLWKTYLGAKTLRALLEAGCYPYARDVLNVMCSLQRLHINNTRNLSPDALVSTVTDDPSFSPFYCIISQCLRLIINALRAQQVSQNVRRSMIHHFINFINSLPRPFITLSLLERFYADASNIDGTSSRTLAKIMGDCNLKPTGRMLRSMMIVESRDGNDEMVSKLRTAIESDSSSTEWTGNQPLESALNNIQLTSLKGKPRRLLQYYSRAYKTNLQSSFLSNSSSVSSTSSNRLDFNEPLSSADGTSLVIVLRTLCSNLKDDPRHNLMKIFEEIVFEMISIKNNQHKDTNGGERQTKQQQQQHNGHNSFSHKPGTPEEERIVNPHWPYNNRRTGSRRTIESSMESACIVTMQELTRRGYSMEALGLWHKYSKNLKFPVHASSLVAISSALAHQGRLGLVCSLFEHLTLRRGEIDRFTSRSVDDDVSSSSSLPHLSNFLPSSKEEKEGGPNSEEFGNMNKIDDAHLQDLFEWTFGEGIYQVPAIRLSSDDVNHLIKIFLHEKNHDEIIWEIWKSMDERWGVKPNHNSLRMLIQSANRSLKKYQKGTSSTSLPESSQLNSPKDSTNDEGQGRKQQPRRDDHDSFQTWDDCTPWEKVHEIFFQMLEGNYPELVNKLDLPVPSFALKLRQFVVYGGISSIRQDENATEEVEGGGLIRRNHEEGGEERGGPKFASLENPEQSIPQYQSIQPDESLFTRFINISADQNDFDSINKALAWFRILKVHPSSRFYNWSLQVSLDNAKSQSQRKHMRSWFASWG